MDVTTGLYMITAISGLIDAVCFLALGGVFAEMMTGNLMLLAFSVGLGQPLGNMVGYGVAIVCFVMGALAGGRLLRGPQELRERRIGFGVEAVVLVAATIVTWLGQPAADNLAGHVVVGMLAFGMGIQNAMMRVHGVPDLATNVLTLTFTGIVADSAAAGGDNRNWRRRGLSMGLFVVSAAVGAILLQFHILWPLLLACSIFILAMIPLMLGDHQTK